MRWLSLALAIALFATITHAEEVLVFVGGARMTVESYEIRGNTVVFTTLDGKLRSVPLSYIDVAAMEGPPKTVNPAETTAPPPAPLAPTAPIAAPLTPELTPRAPVISRADPKTSVEHVTDQIAERVDAQLGKAQRVLALSGADATVQQFRQRVEAQVLELETTLPGASHLQLLEALKQGFDSDEILEVVSRTLAERSSEKQLDSWLAWLECPLARRMIEMKRAARGEQEERSRFAKKIERRPVPENRITLIERLDDLVAATATDVAMHLTMTEVLRESYRRLTETPADDGIAPLRDPVEPRLRDENRTTLLFAYRLLDADELWGYLSYWETQLGKRLTELMKESLVAGARFAGESTARALEQRVADSR